MKKMKGYKVCQCLYDQSEMYWSLGSGYILLYEIGKKTWKRLGDGALAVFINFQDAVNFINNDISYWFHDDIKLFECEYKPELKQRELSWRPHQTESLGMIGPIPQGTDYARWVKLIKEVK